MPFKVEGLAVGEVGVAEARRGAICRPGGPRGLRRPLSGGGRGGHRRSRAVRPRRSRIDQGVVMSSERDQGREPELALEGLDLALER